MIVYIFYFYIVGSSDRSSVNLIINNYSNNLTSSEKAIFNVNELVYKVLRSSVNYKLWEIKWLLFTFSLLPE